MVSNHSPEVSFREVQRLSRVWWVTLIVLGVAALMWYGFIQQIFFGQPFGSNPTPNWMMWLFWLLFGVGFPIVWYNARLIVELRDDHISIRFVPFVTRSIFYADIKQHKVRTYRPLREYGGWGIRGLAGRRAYSVSGNQGVELELNSGQEIMIGSQKPEELALAIASKSE